MKIPNSSFTIPNSQLPRYPKYKDSGVEWLGEVPEHWRVSPIKRLGYLKGGAGFPHENQGVDGQELPFHKVNALARADARGGLLSDGNTVSREVAAKLGAHIFPPGTIVFAKVGAALLLGRIRILTRHACIDNNMMGVVVHQSPCSTQFMLHAMGLIRFDLIANPGAVPSINEGHVADFPLPIPPIPEQTAIAAFLDRETAKLDALVSEQQRLIELLKEKRQAVISHAVTKGLPAEAAKKAGLNPNAPMKPSGIEWLGDVPAHWGITPIKFVAQIGNGSTPSREVPEYWTDGVYPWLNSSVVNQDAVTEAEQFVTQSALQECHLPRVHPPAVLVGITGQGRTRGMATLLLIEATINQHVAYIKPRPTDVAVTFLHRVLQMAYPYLRRDSDAAGSTKGAITCEELGNFKIAVPPIPEQERIVLHVSQLYSAYGSLISESEHVIDLLQERRTALISAAVTGQIDVRAITDAPSSARSAKSVVTPDPESPCLCAPVVK
jgi:type I restriction enzyme S subunit